MVTQMGDSLCKAAPLSPQRHSACAISRASVTPPVSIRELRPYVFCFMSFFLQLARKRTRSGPWSPLASACLEHSIDSGLWTTGAAFAFGAGFAAAGGPAAGGVAGGGVCPNAALAHALKTSTIINFFISAPSDQFLKNPRDPIGLDLHRQRQSPHQRMSKRPPTKAASILIDWHDASAIGVSLPLRKRGTSHTCRRSCGLPCTPPIHRRLSFFPCCPKPG